MSSPIQKIPFTAEAFVQLEKEYHRLQVELEEVKERVKQAREMGDLSENGAYHYGKFELGKLSRQLRHIHFQRTYGYVVPETTHVVGEFGATITLVGYGTTHTYKLVSQFEADPARGKISDESPIGKALLGKKEGESIQVHLPSGIRTYSIQKIC